MCAEARNQRIFTDMRLAGKESIAESEAQKITTEILSELTGAVGKVVTKYVPTAAIYSAFGKI